MAAGKYGSPSAVFLIDGYNLLASAVQGLTFGVESITEPTHGLGDTNESHTPVGMTKAMLEQTGGFFDTTTNSSHAALAAKVPTSVQAVQRVICLGVEGNVTGATFQGYEGAYSQQYNVKAQDGQLTKADAKYTITGAIDRGEIVQPLASKTADWDTASTPVDYADNLSQRVIPITSNSQANPSVVTTPIPHGLTTGQVIVISGVTGSNADINGERTVTVISTTTFSVAVDASTAGGTGGTFVLSSTVNGGAGYLQVTACSGFTNFVGKLRDSPDDSTYADLISFTDNVTAPFAERKTVAGTVDRYLLFDGNVTGTGSITAFCGFARS